MNFIKLESLSLVVLINIFQKLFFYSIFFFIAYILSHNEYGLFETVFSIGNFGVMVCGLQLESAFARYFYIDKNNIIKSIFTIILFYLLGSIFFYLILYFFSPQIFSGEKQLFLIPLSFFVFTNLSYNLLLIYLRFESLFKSYLYLFIYEAALFLLLLFLLYYNSFLTITYLLLIFSIPKLLVMMYIFLKFFDIKNFHFSYSTIYKYLKYSINIVPVVVISFGIILISRIFVLNNFDPIVLSNYSMGLRISMMYLFLTEIFRFMIDPIIIKKDNSKNIDSLLLNVFKQYSKLLVYFNIGMIAFFYIFNTYFLSYKFDSLGIFIPFLFISNFFNLLINYFLLINNLKFKTIYNFISYAIGATLFFVILYSIPITIINLLFALMLFYITTFISIFLFAKRSSGLSYNLKYIYLSIFILLTFLFSSYNV